MAAVCAMLAHAGGSTVWVFSTTLLQLYTEDRFRGRVFAGHMDRATPELSGLCSSTETSRAGCSNR